MAEDINSKTTGHESPAFQVALIDVLIRGLETAKQRMESDDGTPRTFCTLFYAEPGTACPFAYWHRDE